MSTFNELVLIFTEAELNMAIIESAISMMMLLLVMMIMMLIMAVTIITKMMTTEALTYDL